MTHRNDYRSSDPDYRRTSVDHEPSISRDSPDTSRERFHDHPDQLPDCSTVKSFGAGRLKEDYGESRRKPKNLADQPVLNPDEIPATVDPSNDSPNGALTGRVRVDDADDATTAIGQESDTNS